MEFQLEGPDIHIQKKWESMYRPDGDRGGGGGGGASHPLPISTLEREVKEWR